MDDRDNVQGAAGEGRRSAPDLRRGAGQRVPAGAGLFGALVPGAAPLLAIALLAIAPLGEGPSALQWLGIAAVGCGLWIGCGVLRGGLDRATLR